MRFPPLTGPLFLGQVQGATVPMLNREGHRAVGTEAHVSQAPQTLLGPASDGHTAGGESSMETPGVTKMWAGSWDSPAVPSFFFKA